MSEFFELAVDLGIKAVDLGMSQLGKFFGRPTTKQIDNVVRFIDGTEFVGLRRVMISNGFSSIKLVWQQGIVFFGPLEILVLGWDDVECLKDGTITAENWTRHSFGDSKSRLVDYRNLANIKVAGGFWKLRHIQLQTSTGDDFCLILADSFKSNSSKRKYNQFITALQKLVSEQASRPNPQRAYRSKPKFLTDFQTEDANGTLQCLNCGTQIAKGINKCPSCGWSWAEEDINT